MINKSFGIRKSDIINRRMFIIGAAKLIIFGGLMLLILFLMVSKGNFEDIIPIIALYSFAGYRLMPALQQIYNAKTQIRFSEPALNNLHKDITNLKKYKKFDSKINNITFNEEISLEKINFSYPNNEKNSIYSNSIRK